MWAIKTSKGFVGWLLLSLKPTNCARCSTLHTVMNCLDSHLITNIELLPADCVIKSHCYHTSLSSPHTTQHNTPASIVSNMKIFKCITPLKAIVLIIVTFFILAGCSKQEPADRSICRRNQNDGHHQTNGFPEIGNEDNRILKQDVAASSLSMISSKELTGFSLGWPLSHLVIGTELES